MVPLVVGDIRLPARQALTSIAHGYQIIWVLLSGSVLHVVDRRAYGCSFSFRLTGKDATSDSEVHWTNSSPSKPTQKLSVMP